MFLIYVTIYDINLLNFYVKLNDLASNSFFSSNCIWRQSSSKGKHFYHL